MEERAGQLQDNIQNAVARKKKRAVSLRLHG